MLTKTAPLLVVAAILFDGGLCDCYCDDFRYFSWNFGFSLNISLNETEILWEIVKPNGEYEVYTVANYSDYRHGRRESITERGLSFGGFCDYDCYVGLTITPTDLRYNGAQITGIVRLPECFNTSNTTNTTTLGIQGILKAPTDVSVEAVGVDSINVSWSAPFTLEGVPILHYSVYITSQGVSEQRNTTETHITLERPCASTTYQISAWNEVGEGNATRNAYPNIMKAAIKATSELSKTVMCFSCTFLADSTADGCAVTMENNKHVFVFNVTRTNNSDDNLVLLECFSVPEGGEYSVSVHEIHNGVHVCTQVNNITVWITESSSLIHSRVKPVSGWICAFCVFTNGSTAKGCAITLFSDQITFNYTIPRHSTYDIALQECFKVQQSGSYHVLVSDILMDGSEGYNTLELPDVTIALASATDNTAKQEDGTPTVAGLSAVLCLTSMGLIIAVLLASILFLKRRSKTWRKNNVCTDSECTTDQQQPAAVTTAPLYENTQLVQPPSSSVTDGGDNMYEHVELRPITGQEKEIAVAPNAAYGTVRR
ncbi:hypothetical protein GBAR_LOCUS15312 [Geodia barretti]|uniref:Fibronectin type-III domain-containing protein n=1 Tax=Geodia barretti TaxID=519541 RepID=A0AA35SBL9_GEOBA|nr:hypothetical protein GBAR_LOCUS15312 [Geodia barretti]